MVSGKIYNPAKTAMQSGVANAGHWVLEFTSKDTQFIDPVMGWTGNTDTSASEITLKFKTKDDAVKYAESNGIEYSIIEPHVKAQKIKAYIDNFR